MRSLPESQLKSRHSIALAAIILLAAILRFVGLTRDSLWTDETFSGFASQLSSLSEVIRFIASDVHPPGYFIALWGWAQAFGNSDFTLRAFSAVGGILLVPLAFRLGRQLFDLSTGLLSAFFAAVLIQGIYYSQEVRAYIWMAVFSALSVSLLIDLVRARDPGRIHWGLWSGFVGACTLNAYFHYSSLMFSLLLIAGWVLFDLQRKRSIWFAVGAGVAMVALFSPWLPIMLGSANKARWIPKPSLRYVAETANILYGPGFMLVGLTILVFIVAGFRASQTRVRFWQSPEKWLLGWILMPVLVSVAISLVQKPIYTPRNMMVAFVAGAILLARAILQISDQRRAQWMIAIGLAIGMFGLHARFGNGYMFSPTKQQVREAANFVTTHNAEGLPIYTVGWDRENFSYYFRFTEGNYRLRNVTEEEVQAKGLSQVVKEDRFWIASAGLDINGIENLAQSFVIEDRGEFKEARAYLVRRIER